MGFADDRLQLVRREGRQVGVRGAVLPPDAMILMKSAPSLTSWRTALANTVGAVGLAAEPVEVTAGDRHRPARDDHARPVGDASLDRLADGEGDPPLRAVLADRGDARNRSIARALTVARTSSRSSSWTARSSPRVPSPMPTRWVCPSTRPGQDRRVAVLVRRRHHAVGRPDLRSTADGPDRAALDQDGRILQAGRRPTRRAGGRP